MVFVHFEWVMGSVERGGEGRGRRPIWGGVETRSEQGFPSLRWNIPKLVIVYGSVQIIRKFVDNRVVGHMHACNSTGVQVLHP